MEDYRPHYIDAHSILIVTSTGSMRRLYCPFRVLCVQNIRKFKPGLHLWVAEVVTNTRGELIYMIYDAPFHYSYFRINASS